MDKNRSTFLSVVCFFRLEILEDISKPTFKHFSQLTIYLQDEGILIILFCVYLQLAHNHVVFNNLTLSTDEYI